MSEAPVQRAKTQLLALFDELLGHDGYGSIRVEMRILRRGQKEVIVDCGKQYRFVVDAPAGHRAPRPVSDATTPDAVVTDGALP